MAFKKPKNKFRRKAYPKRTKEVWVTQEMLYEVRDDLKSQIGALAHNMEARFSKVDDRFLGVDARFDQIESRMENLKSRMDQLEIRMDRLEKRMDRLEARMDRLEKRMDLLEVRIDEMEKRIDAKFESFRQEMNAQFHQLKLLLEEQNARNAIVLDGLTNLFARQERIEEQMLDLQK